MPACSLLREEHVNIIAACRYQSCHAVTEYTLSLLHRGATSAHYLRRWQHVDHIIALSGEKFSLGGMKGIHSEFDGNGLE